MADQLYQLPYDDEIDKDIHEWLKGLKRSRKAEMVRHAIRFYITSTGQNKYTYTMPIMQQEAAPLVPVQANPVQQEQPTAAPVEAQKPKQTHKKKPNLPLDGQF